MLSFDIEFYSSETDTLCICAVSFLRNIGTVKIILMGETKWVTHSLHEFAIANNTTCITHWASACLLWWQDNCTHGYCYHCIVFANIGHLCLHCYRKKIISTAAYKKLVTNYKYCQLVYTPTHRKQITWLQCNVMHKACYFVFRYSKKGEMFVLSTSLASAEWIATDWVRNPA